MMRPDQYDAVRLDRDDGNPLAISGLFAAALSGAIVGFSIGHMTAPAATHITLVDPAGQPSATCRVGPSETIVCQGDRQK
jgi:hypothetical protein